MDELTSRAVRISREPFEYVDEHTVHAVLTASPEAYISFIDRSLREISSGQRVVEQPGKWIFSKGRTGGDFRVMPCVVKNGASYMKTVKLIGTNTVQSQVPDQITVGKAFRIHPEENYVSHILEACLLSSARTGACATIAVKYLAPARRKITRQLGARFLAVWQSAISSGPYPLDSDGWRKASFC